MALALGEGAEATAPLGRAVIGGLAAATVATLIVLPSVYSLVQQSARVGSPSMDPDDPASAYRSAGSGMRMQTHFAGERAQRSARSRCWRWPRVAATRPPRPPRRPRRRDRRPIEVVKVVEQPLNVTLSLPGELTPYQTVALYSRVTGFVKTIAVDRGSRVRAGEQLAVLEAPELGRAEGRSAVEAAERGGATRGHPIEGRGEREHVREVESGVRHAGRGRRQRCGPGAEGGRGRPGPDRGRPAERRSGPPGARSRSATWKGTCGSPRRSAAS